MLPMWYMAQDRLARWDKFSHPAIRPVYTIGLDTGGMMSTKPPSYRQPGGSKNQWVPILSAVCYW